MSQLLFPPSLDRLFRPRSVVFIGASADPSRLTARPPRLLRKHGFEGLVHMVHRQRQEIDGVPAVPSVAELPFAPDVAVVMVPAAGVPEVAEACGRRGARHLVVLSSGFEEAPDGAPLAAQLRETARRHGMGVVGPNSEGLWFVPGRAILTFGSAANRDRLLSGPVAVISQSGSIGASIMRRLNDSGLGADTFVSVGNESVYDAADYLNWIVGNGGVRVVVCFLEGLKDGRSFLAAAARARAEGIAVVVLQSGSSPAGRAASASHTGKVSSSATVYRSLFAQAGVLTVGSVEELADAAAVLSGPWLPEPSGEGPGRGVTVIGLSGGSRGIIADAASERGLPLAVLADATTTELATFIPDFGAVSNPVDPTGQVLSDPEMFPRTIRALAGDPHTEALLVQYANGGLALVERHIPDLVEAHRAYRIPILVSCLLEDAPADHPTRRRLLAEGLHYANDPTRAVARLGLIFRWRDAQRLSPFQVGPPGTRQLALTGWHAAAAFVAESDIHPPREVRVAAGTGSSEIREQLGAAQLAGPLVVKPSPDEVEHKSDAGLVHLGLTSPSEVAAALAEIVAKVPGCSGVLVQEQLPTTVEMLVVLRWDDDFGPVMGIGLGGFLVELLSDLAFVALPATPEQIAAAMRRTRLGTLLDGYRGGPVVDVGTVTDALANLGERYTDLASPPTLLELNPVTADATGRLYVLDALIEQGPRT